MQQKKPTLFVYLLTPPPFLKKKTPTKILSSTDNGVIFKKKLSTFFYMSKYDVELIERFPFNSTPGHHNRHTSTPYHWKPWISCYDIKSIIKKMRKIMFHTIIKFTSNISNCTTNLWFTWFSYIAVTFQSTSVTEIPIRAWKRAIMSKWSYASWKMLKEKLNIDVLMNVTCNIIET